MTLALGQPLSETITADRYTDEVFAQLSARERWCLDLAAKLFPQLLPLAHKLKVDKVDAPEDRAAIIAHRFARNVLWYGLPFDERKRILELRRAEKDSRRDGSASPASEPTGSDSNPYASSIRAEREGRFE